MATIIPIEQLTKQITINVEIAGYRGFLVRLYFAKALIALACLIAGMGVKFKKK